MKWSEVRKTPMYNLGKLALLFLCTGLVYYSAIRAAGLLLPFVFALLCAMAMEPLIRLLCKLHIKGYHFPRGAATVITMLVAGGAAGIGLVFLVNQTITQLIALVQAIPGWANEFTVQLGKFAVWVEDSVTFLPDDVALSITNEVASLLSTLVRQISTIVNPLARGVWSTAQMLPLIILSVIMFFVGTFYIASWRPRILAFMSDSLPVQWMDRMSHVKRRLFATMWGYLRAQLLLLVAVFVVLFIGLSILRVEYALALALVIAAFDALPVIGSGLFLNTWAVYCLATGNIGLALGLFLTYIAIIVSRNLLEPRLVSVQIGLPPLVTMVAMYAGLRLFGVLGLIGGPILMVILSIVYEYYAHGRTLRQILNGEPPPSTEGEEKDVDKEPPPQEA